MKPIDAGDSRAAPRVLGRTRTRERRGGHAGRMHRGDLWNHEFHTALCKSPAGRSCRRSPYHFTEER